jgi:hypothetical protein
MSDQRAEKCRHKVYIDGPVGNRTHDPSVQVVEKRARLTLRGQCDRLHDYKHQGRMPTCVAYALVKVL